MAGFTEDDDMLSNMIRAKYIDRNEALKDQNLSQNLVMNQSKNI